MKIEMQDQKQHVIISICSFIVGNNISDRRSAEPAKETVQRSEQETTGMESPGKAQLKPEEEPKPVTPATAAENSPAPSLPQTVGRAVGTLALALLVWRAFGCKRKRGIESEA